MKSVANTRPLKLHLTIILSALLISFATPTWAVTPVEEEILEASDGAAGADFGWRVAVEGDTAVVGGYRNRVVDRNAGAVYVYERDVGNLICPDSWCEVAILRPFGPLPYDDHRLGSNVAISGDTIIGGASRDDTNGDRAGSAYVYVKDGGVWKTQQKLLASDGAAFDHFGNALAIDGDKAYVGSGSGGSGAVYEFTRAGTVWTETAKIMPDIPVPGQNFGGDIALHGDTLLVAAGWESTATDAQIGAAYVFTRQGGAWVQQARLEASDGDPGDRFGVGVALDGDTALIGAPQDSDVAPNSGSAYVFTRSSGVWTQRAKLANPPAGNGDSFGFQLALSGHTAVIPGDLEDVAPLINSGAAYVYTGMGANWSLRDKITASDATDFQALGWGIALDDDTLLLGAPGNKFSFTFNEGAAYLLDLNVDFDDDGYEDSLDNCPIDANGSQSDIDLDGAGDVCDVCPSDATDTCDPNASASEEIDPDEGGTVETPDGEFAMDIDPGDLPAGEGTSISVTDAQPADPNVDLSIGTNANSGTSLGAWDLGPDGLVLTNPILVTLAIDVTALNQNQRDKIDVYRLNEATGKFEPLGATCSNNEDPPGSGTIIAICEFELSSFSVYAMVAPEDEDLDGVPDNFEDVVDACPATVMPETTIPTSGSLGNNRWALRNADGTFVQAGPQAGSVHSFDINDTYGCTCQQVIDAAGLGKGQTRNGCTTSALLEWINSQ